MLKIIKYFLLVLLVASCTPKPFLQRVKSAETNLAKYANVYVQVLPLNAEIKKTTGFEPTKKALQKQFINDLKKTNKFSLVTNDIPENYSKDSLLISLVIEQLNYRHASLSFVFGIFSGNSSIKVLLKIKDASDGKYIAGIRAGAKNKSSGGILRGGTSKLVVQISEKLADEVEKLKKP